MDAEPRPNTGTPQPRGPLGVSRNWWILIGAGIAVALFITLFSPFASSHPDGLEKVADDKGFLEEGKDPSYEIIPDYTFPGVENEQAATILSGIVGVLIVAALGLGFGYLMRRSRRSSDAPAPSAPASGSPGAGG
jgi:cobalt/nickel transport protein